MTKSYISKIKRLGKKVKVIHSLNCGRQGPKTGTHFSISDKEFFTRSRLTHN